MDEFLQLCARHFDLSSGAAWPLDPKSAEYRTQRERLWDIEDLDDDQPRVEGHTKILEASSFLGEAVPFFCVNAPLKIANSDSSVGLRRFRDDDGSRNQLQERFNSTAIADLAGHLEKELSRCKAADTISPALVALVLGIPKRGADTLRCVRMLREHGEWFTSWIRRHYFQGWSSSRAQFWDLECAVACLAPSSELATHLSKVQLGKVSHDTIIASFKPLIRPDQNFGLPTVYVPYRNLIYDSICVAFSTGDASTRCDAFELWARLNPVPFDLFEEFIAIVEATNWLGSLNECQLLRVALLLADVCSDTSGQSNSARLRDRWCELLVTWIEDRDAPRCQVAKHVLEALCDWSHRPAPVIVGGQDPRRIRHAKQRALTASDSVEHVTILLQSFDATWTRPWNRRRRFAGNCGIGGQRELGQDHRRNGDFEASMLKAIVASSNDELARAKAYWSLGCMASSDCRYEEIAYNAFHSSLGTSRAPEALARNLLHHSLNRFQQDYGPVNASHGRVLEQAAAKIDPIKHRWHGALINFLKLICGADRERSADLLDECFQDVLLQSWRAKNLADLDLERAGALHYLKRLVDLWWRTKYREKGPICLPAIDLEYLTTKCVHSFNDGDTNERVHQLLLDCLRLLPDDEAAAGFFAWARPLSRESAAACLRVSTTSLDELLKQARKRIRQRLPDPMDELYSS